MNDFTGPLVRSHLSGTLVYQTFSEDVYSNEIKTKFCFNFFPLSYHPHTRSHSVSSLPLFGHTRTDERRLRVLRGLRRCCTSRGLSAKLLFSSISRRAGGAETGLGDTRNFLFGRIRDEGRRVFYYGRPQSLLRRQ